MKRLILLGALLSAVGLAGCAFKPKADRDLGVDASAEMEKASDEVYHPSPEFGTIEFEVNPAVQKWLNYYTGRGRRHMNRYLSRSSRYLPMMKSILRSRGMPEDLVFVPLIESGYNSSAHSHASAVGYWQFIRGTGKRYGLIINQYVDERQDPVLSTNAGADYFAALYNLFGDWYLALAAYNTGENRVKRAVMKTRSRNFWHLAKKRRLYRETRNYVPKFLAAALIHKNPEKYGFTNIDYQDAFSYDEVEVSRSISLIKLGKAIGVEYKDLQRLNPSYRSDFVPIYRKPAMMIRVPKGYGVKAVAGVAKSYSDKPLLKIAKGHFWYKVRRGDTISGIAHRYRTRVSTLRRLNRLGRRSLIRVGQKIKVPERGGSVARRSKKSGKRLASSTKKGSYHVVRRGENLSVIAEKYRTSVGALRRLNRLSRRGFIRVGQRLRLPSVASSTKKLEKKGTERSAVSSKVYVVQRGDNLSNIAKKNGLSLKRLKRLNLLGRRSVIRPGQVLVIRGKGKVHVVRRGENLSRIAARYRISVRKIAGANAIKNGSMVHVGRELVIPE